MKLRLFSPPAVAAPARDFDLLATAVLMLDDRQRIAYANPAAENLFELSRRRTDRRKIARSAHRHLDLSCRESHL